MTPAERRTCLEKQFDEAIKSHQMAAKVDEATPLETDGSNLCTSGKHGNKIATLEPALKGLGVKTKS